jgi:5-methylcytosine-specific restriction endonuclease McrA
MPVNRDYRAASAKLLAALGIDVADYDRFVAWCLAEELVVALKQAITEDAVHQREPYWVREDGLLRFRELVRRVTRRADWSVADIDVLYKRVEDASKRHYRAPINAAELLRLLWNLPHECAICCRKPPEVLLHIDHVFPASRGGKSVAENLRFLCAEHNLKKSDHLEEDDLWLNTV